MHRHSRVEKTDSRLYETNHEQTKYRSITTTITDSLCDFFNLDPTTHQINLDDHILTADLDRGYRHYQETGECVTVTYPIGDYHLNVCCCGNITIYGNQTDHEQGNLKPPDSMC